MWTKKQQKAVEFSFKAHGNQQRKDGKTLYISHPMSVGIILGSIGCGENVIIAGILHDIIEDTDIKKEKIKSLFGKKVADLVDQVSEEDKNNSYLIRKKKMAEKISVAENEVILIKAADILSNMTDLVVKLEKYGEKVFDIFNADKNRKIKQTEKMVSVVSQRLNSQRLINKLEKRLIEIKKYEDRL